MEIWKSIKSINGKYEVSNMGNVRHHIKKKVLKPGISRDGYLQVSGGIKNEFRATIHRLVAIYFIHNPENKPCVNHIDGNKQNNYVNNLEWSTYSENNKHAWDNSLIQKKYGENNKDAILTQKQADEIRIHKKNGLKHREISALYNISESLSMKIVANKKYISL